MPVSVVQVGIMRVGMAQRIVSVPVGVRFAEGAVMGMLVVGVVGVAMLMLQRHMHVVMGVALCQMQPKPKRHQPARQDDLCGQRVVQQTDRQNRADERGEREIGPSPCGSQVAQGQHEQDKADANAEEPDRSRSAGDAE